MAILFAVFACGPTPDQLDSDPLIIGGVDWVDVTTLDPQSPERARSRAVGYLSLPAQGTRCTAFLIAADVLMTNHHCVPDAAAARGAVLDLTRETGVPAANRARYACDTRLGGDEALDFALLRCAGEPGAAHGVLPLTSFASNRGDGIYVLHQNCDYYSAPRCDPTKKLSAGQVRSTGAQLAHDADTLGGSSGSPVLDARTHEVVGLHNLGVGNNGGGRGFENRAVPMSRIVPALRSRFPSLALGGADPTPPTGLQPDALEPNDEAGQASPLTAADGLTLHPGDQDVFRLDLEGPADVTITLRFAHAEGDVDAELRQDGLTGPAVATAVSPDDDERLEVSGLAAGVYFLRVYGYDNATNRYDLAVTVTPHQDRPPPPSSEPPPEPPADAEPFEPNDRPELAPVVAVPFVMPDGLRIADGADVDYFAFDGDGGRRTITIEFSHATGDLDLFVEDAAGNVVATSNGVSDAERIEQAFGPGRYFVKIAGWRSAAGAYALSLQ